MKNKKISIRRTNVYVDRNYLNVLFFHVNIRYVKQLLINQLCMSNMNVPRRMRAIYNVYIIINEKSFLKKTLYIMLM
jgi:hypothetical protein